MGISIKHRWKTVVGTEMSMSQFELDRGFAYRSKRRCEQFYRVGDVRKAKSRVSHCSLGGAKVRITSIAFDKGARKTKVTFARVRENKPVHYLKMED
jgi:phage terminase large subunit GpA-like protein